MTKDAGCDHDLLSLTSIKSRIPLSLAARDSKDLGRPLLQRLGMYVHPLQPSRDGGSARFLER